MEASQLQKFDEAATAMVAVQSRVDEVGKKVDAIDTDMMKKAAADSAKALEDFQKLEASKRFDEIEAARKSSDDRMDDLLAHLSRDGKFDAANNDNRAYYQAMDEGLRKKSREVLPEHRDLFKVQLTKTMARNLPHLSDASLDELVTKTFNTAIGPDGGYLVPVDRQDEQSRRQFETSPMRDMATVTSTVSNMVERVINDNELAVTWGSEKSPISNADTPELGIQKFDVHNMTTRPLITENMLEDAGTDIVGDTMDLADDAFMRAQNTEFVRGTGSQRPKGFLSYATHVEAQASSVGNDPYVRGELGVHNSGTLGSFDADGIIRFHGLLKEAYRPGASWAMQRATWYNMLQLKGNDNHYLLSAFQLANNAEFRLMGDPVRMMQDMDAPGNNTVPIAHGNFGVGYLVVDRVGMSVLVDPYSEDPFIRYRFRMRVGGGVKNYEAIKLFQLSV